MIIQQAHQLPVAGVIEGHAESGVDIDEHGNDPEAADHFVFIDGAEILLGKDVHAAGMTMPETQDGGLIQIDIRHLAGQIIDEIPVQLEMDDGMIGPQARGNHIGYVPDALIDMAEEDAAGLRPVIGQGFRQNGVIRPIGKHHVEAFRIPGVKGHIFIRGEAPASSIAVLPGLARRVFPLRAFLFKKIPSDQIGADPAPAE